MELNQRLAALAGDVVAAQDRLDDAHWADLARLRHVVDGLDLSDPGIAALLPPRMTIDRVTIDVEMALEDRRTVAGSVGLNLLARPVHTFLHRRFGVSSDRTSRVSITVDAVPQPGEGPLNSSRSNA